MQLDQLLAPIALYPDELLGQILMAATYPLEIVQADRWLQSESNAALRGSQLLQALEQEPWDQSVKSLVAFPQVLSAMDNNLSWTEALGDAFVAQQSDVMDQVQQLRARALAARTLISSLQQTITDTDQTIAIDPTGSGTVYVPEYDPNVVYGNWPYLENPPDDFELPDYTPGGFLAFVILAPLWGWNAWDWPHHRISVRPPAPIRSPGVGPARRPETWRHDPAHRHGVPYGSDVARAMYENPGGGHAVEFRGYAPVPNESNSTGYGEIRSAQTLPRIDRPADARAGQSASTGSRSLPGPEPRPTPPALESFGRGAMVQTQEQRGASSRVSTPAGSAHSGGGRERR
jgi:hypothetical protein